MLFISASTRERLSASPDELSLVGEFEIRGRTAKLPCGRSRRGG